MQQKITVKNIIMILVMISLVVLSSIYNGWLKTNCPLLYPYHSVVFGIAIGIGTLLKALPGQIEEEDTSKRTKVITFLGCVVLTLLFFAGFDWINTNYPHLSKPLRALVLVLLYFGWRVSKAVKDKMIGEADGRRTGS